MVATFRQLDGKGDLSVAVQTAMGLGASIPFSCPVLTVALPNGDSFTIQEDGQIAIYKSIGFDFHLVACQCQGEIVPEIPRVADQLIALNLMGVTYRLYRYRDNYFSYVGDTFTLFKNYPLGTDPTVASEKGDQECDSMHRYPPLIPKEYRDEVDKQELIPDTRKPRDRKN